MIDINYFDLIKCNWAIFKPRTCTSCTSSHHGVEWRMIAALDNSVLSHQTF
jgi:hypothetical protein